MLIVTSSRNQYSGDKVSQEKLTIDFCSAWGDFGWSNTLYLRILYIDFCMGRLLHGGNFGCSNKMFTHNLCGQWESGKSWQRACSACQLRYFVKKNIIYILYTLFFFKFGKFSEVAPFAGDTSDGCLNGFARNIVIWSQMRYNTINFEHTLLLVLRNRLLAIC